MEHPTKYPMESYGIPHEMKMNIIGNAMEYLMKSCEIL